MNVHVKKAALLLLLTLQALTVSAGGDPTVILHQVGVGDSLESIAQEYLGDRKHADSVRRMNPHIDEVGVQIGDILSVPNSAMAEQLQIGQQPAKTFVKPNPVPLQVKQSSIQTIPGWRNGLAQVYLLGKFRTVPAPVSKE